MRSGPARVRNLVASVSLLAVAAMTSAGCGMSDITNSSGALSGSTFRRSATPVSTNDWQREAVAAGERYKANPRDAGAALRKGDQRAQAAAVLQQASIAHPADRRVLGAYGRALADTGNLEQALEVLSRAHSPDQPDWRILSAQGAVLDQMEKIVPDEASVLSNLGLSYALAKDLKKAEDVL